ncbi:MAG: sel1 repeat family protein [Deltaproteobacteria bacterium]|nr:sel1 repeat family protein [Deltaproteobacteria bacterium]
MKTQLFSCLIFALVLSLVALSDPVWSQDKPAPKPAAKPAEKPAEKKPESETKHVTSTAKAELTQPDSGQDGPRQISVPQLITLLEAEAAKNNPQAMSYLGSIYEQGVGQPSPNFGKALEWYQKAAALDLPEALYAVGICYEWGKGIGPDTAKAVTYYEKSAAKGFAQAEEKVANIYLSGYYGVKQDVAKGLDYLQKASSKGFTRAMKHLGAIYYFGQYDQTRDLTKALNFFTQAAEAGDPEAMKNLGAMSNSGEGIQANKTEGYKWFLLAKEFGFSPQDMDKTLEELRKDLKPEQIKTAQAEAKNWGDKLRARREAQEKARQEALAAAQAAAK